MTREEAKDIVFNYALGQKINDGINTLDEIIDQIFDEHEAKLKAKDEEINSLKRDLTAFSMLLDEPIDKKSRSIVAMLFWEWKKQCKNCEQYNDHAFAREQKRSEAYYCFKKAYAMLKATT